MTSDGPDSFAVGPQPRRLVPIGAVIAVAVGGALGAPARYALGHAIPAPNGFPVATLTVNLTGAFVLGLLVVVVAERLPPTRYLRPFFGTGVLGAYTTYSTFAVDLDLLTRHGRIGLAAAYVGATLAGGLLAAWLGAGLGRAVPLLGRSA